MTMRRDARGSGLWILVTIAAAALWAIFELDLSLGDLVPGEGGVAIARDFFARALSPAWSAEAEFVPAGTPPLLALALEAIVQTLRFAGAAMALAIPLGLVLGILGSARFWRVDSNAGNRLGASQIGAKSLASSVWRKFGFAAVRLAIAGMRSVHEFLWAVVFLVALGLSDGAALLAIAIPYGGTLAKVFSELLDESPDDTLRALRAVGAGSVQAFVLGVVPRALPDVTAYTFYRFECALRASAVLGFFGYPTVGLYIRQSFLSSNYGEVWTFLYALLALVLLFDAWSRYVRRRLVAGRFV